MVRQSPRTRPETLERHRTAAAPALLSVAREVSHGRTTIVLTRDFDGDPAAVWSLLTAPAKLRLWAPYTADRDLSQVGRVVLRMLDDTGTQDVGMSESEVPDGQFYSVVLVAERPRLLEHSWASDLLDWRLDPLVSGCRLTLHQTLADERMASANAAGWHLCLDVGSSVLAGAEVIPVRGAEALKHGWAELNERYAVALRVAPTRLS